MKNILQTYTIILSRYMTKSILAICMLGTVISCGSKNEAPASADSTHLENSVTLSTAQLKNAGIVLGKIEQRSISGVLKVNGRVDVPPQNMISVSVPMGGYLKYTKLLPGMHLSKGEVIAIMEDQQYTPTALVADALYFAQAWRSRGATRRSAARTGRRKARR